MGSDSDSEDVEASELPDLDLDLRNVNPSLAATVIFSPTSASPRLPKRGGTSMHDCPPPSYGAWIQSRCLAVQDGRHQRR
jgi:hypothetical protein